MSMTIPLPSSLQHRLAGVASRVRRLRGLRGLSLLVLVLALLGGIAMLVDYALDASLPSALRGVHLAIWCGLGMLLLVRGVLRPLFQSIDPTALAALVEERHPDLAERLTSSVELAQHADFGNGSPELIELLVRDTERRTRGLDFTPITSGRSTRTLTLLALAALCLVLAPAAVAPLTYARHAERFFLPWSNPLAPADFTFAVEPGDCFAARGRLFTVSVELTPAEHQSLPPSATLLVVAADGSEVRHDLVPDEDTGRYQASFRLTGDVHYQVLAGNAVSDRYSATAVTPVDLAADSPRLTVTPPAYASAALDEEVLTGLVDFAALRHSRIDVELRFTRPAAAASLVWQPQGDEKKPAEAETVGLRLHEDGLGASGTLTARVDGVYRLVLEAEHGIRTERDGARLTVKADQPPALLKYLGKETVQTARPDDRLPLEARLADDIGVAGADLLYQLNTDTKTHEEPFKLDAVNARTCAARHQFLLTGKVKDGDVVRYRLRYRDNLPSEFGGPHVRFHPEEGWLELRISARQSSLREKEILQRRDDLNRKLEQIKADLKQEQRRVLTVRQLVRQQTLPSRRLAESFDELREQNQKTEQALRELSRETAEEAGMRELSEKSKDVADQEMRRAEAGLQDAASQKTTPTARNRRLEETENELDRALKKLDDMKAANEKAAAAKLDQIKVEALADRQQQLAEKTAELAGKHPVFDPEAKKLGDEMRREQEEVARKLRELTENSDTLKKALEQARAEQLRQAGERARELAQAQRDLAQASEETEKRRAAEQTSDLARKQEELARKTAELARDTEQPARANFSRPLQTEDSQKAAESLSRGDTDKAVQEQDRAARELERLGHDLKRARDLADDPREAARQLARLEAELARQTRKQLTKPDEEKQADLKRDQQAIREAAEKLSVPPTRPEAQAEQRKAVEQLAAAQKALANKDMRRAAEEMERAQQTLRDLTAKLPYLAERRRQALNKLQELMRDQDTVARQTREAAQDPKNADSKLAEATKKQARVAEELGKLDAPNQEERRERAEDNVKQALRDLAERRKEDQAASQADARRALDRLAQAISGQKPVDEKAAALAAKQKDLAERADKAAADKATPANKLDELKAEQRKLAEDASALDAPEAPASKRAAAEAARRAADEANQKAPTSKESRQAMAEAARKLDDLARALDGQEKAADKAGRLAQAQKALAEQTEREGSTPASRERQKDVAEEAKGLRGGESARGEAEKAREATRQAEQAPAPEQAKAQARAAEALKGLADKLAKGPEAKQEEAAAAARKKAAELAREQARLAEATRQAAEAAAKKPGKAGEQDLAKAMEKLQGDQKGLNEQTAKAKTPPAGEKAMQQARQAMEQARQALEKKDAAAAGEKQQEAARALEQVAKQPSSAQGKPEANRAALPSTEQVERVRALAKEQRELQDEVRKQAEQGRVERRADNAPNRDNPTGKLAGEQTEIAREAAKLARDVAGEQGERSSPARRAAEAGQSAAEAAKNLQAGASEPAKQAGQQTAGELRRLADELSKTPRGSDSKGDTLQQARQLAGRQEELNRQMAPLAGNPSVERAQQQARQADLARQTQDLAKQLDQATALPGRTQQSSRTAAQNARSAESSMQAARNQAQEGNQTATQSQRDLAARNLDQLARTAEQASGQAQPGEPSTGQQAGQSVQQAGGEIAQAQAQLGQNQSAAARASMSRAAQALANAAQQLAQAAQPGREPGKPASPGDPGDQGAAEGGVADSRALPGELAAHAGKRWGELPGELRTRIVQQMKARYGDDYARMIKLYFEQIADTRRR